MTALLPSVAAQGRKRIPAGLESVPAVAKKPSRTGPRQTAPSSVRRRFLLSFLVQAKVAERVGLSRLVLLPIVVPEPTVLWSTPVPLVPATVAVAEQVSVAPVVVLVLWLSCMLRTL